MSSSRSKYLSIQQSDRFSSPVPISSQWNSSFRESSHRFSGIPSTTTSHSPSPSSTPSLTGKDHQQQRLSSIRNSAHSHSTALCLQQCRWCKACYDNKLITIEPVLFVVMFAVYLHKIVFELYSFNTFARHSVDKSGEGGGANASNRSRCIQTTDLDNVTYMESIYHVDGLLWSNKTGDRVEAETGLVLLMVGVVQGFFSVFGTLLLGPLANRFGRKPTLALILGGMLAQTLLTALVVQFHLDLHLFVLGAGLRGITGGVAGVYTVSYSYITEFGREQKRWLVLRIGVIETLSFVAVSLGLFLGGVALTETRCDFEFPAYFVVGCILSSLLYSVIATSDSRHELASSANRSPLPEKQVKVHVGPRALLSGLRMLCGSGGGGSGGRGYPRIRLWLSLSVMAVTVLNSSGMTAIITLFLLHRPLVWSPLLIGGFLGMSEFLHGLVLVVVLPLLLSLGVHDGTIVTLSMLMTISMNITLAFSEETWHVFLVGIIQSAEVLIVPTLKAMLAKSAPVTERGALFTLISVVQTLSTIAGIALYLPIYILSLDKEWPPGHSGGASFLLMATLYALTIPLMCVLSLANWCEKRRERQREVETSHTSPPTSVYGADERSTATPTHNPSAPLLSKSRPGVQGRQSFEVSIGQDVADKEASMREEVIRVRRRDRERNFLEQSYSSLSDYHAQKQ